MAAESKATRATVARGRTLNVDGKRYGPGDEVQLPRQKSLTSGESAI